MSGRKAQKRPVRRQPIWQQLAQSPARYLWGIGLMTGVFLLLGLFLRFFWGTEPQAVPFIEGCQGPFRVRPTAVKDKTPSHRIYGDLSLQTPEKSIESLLPPEEQPSLPEEVPLPLLPAATPAVSPKEQKTQRQTPALQTKTNTSSKKPLHSLDELLQQIDEVVSPKTTPPPQKPALSGKKGKGR